MKKIGGGRHTDTRGENETTSRTLKDRTRKASSKTQGEAPRTEEKKFKHSIQRKARKKKHNNEKGAGNENGGGGQNGRSFELSRDLILGLS